MKRIIVVATVALLACSAPQTVDPGVTHEHKAATQSAVVPSAEANVQLAAARAATARYQKIENALADGFVDINVFMPGMGYHFLNEQRLNATFDAGAPELLVYNIE